MSAETHSRHYGTIFISLFVLTIIEIFAANLPVSKFLIILTLVGLALMKAALVAIFYMHLKDEKLLLIIIALAPLIFSFIFTLVIGADLAG